VASTALDLGPGGKNRLVAFKGFSVALDDEKHTLSLAVDVNEDRGDLLFKNWREKMRRELPPGSLTAYREPGEARWDADVVALTFDDAQVLPLMDEGRIQWPGWGRDANAANAEAVGSVLYALRADAPVGLADTPIELAGTRVEELRGRSGVFRPRRAWAKGGRRRDRLEEDCVDASPPVLPDEAAAAAVLRQLTELGGLLTALAEAAPRAEPMAHDDPTPLLVRVVSGADIAPPGSTGGGLVYLRPADLGWESVGDDWWVRQGELDTVLRGRLLSTPGGRLRWDGRITWTEGARPLRDVRGTVELSTKHGERTLAAELTIRCGRKLDVRVTLRDPGSCSTWDGGIGSARLKSTRDQHEVVFDGTCDGCVVAGAWCAEAW
jgi:hypothetical protein